MRFSSTGINGLNVKVTLSSDHPDEWLGSFRIWQSMWLSRDRVVGLQIQTRRWSCHQQLAILRSPKHLSLGQARSCQSCLPWPILAVLQLNGRRYRCKLPQLFLSISILGQSVPPISCESKYLWNDSHKIYVRCNPGFYQRFNTITLWDSLRDTRKLQISRLA